MRDPDHGWDAPPRRTTHGGLPQPVSLWDPPPRQASGSGPPAGRAPAPRPRWYRRAWFVSLVVVVAFGAAGAVLGSQPP
jgi:hypothetical protein